jgi:iron complex outermembrane receptor protein
LVTPRLRLTPDVMVYGRFASGYRPGGTNAQVSSATPGFPNRYGPDKTQNYEAGIKGSFLDGRISLDAAAYYIDWKNIQVNVQLGIPPYVVNTGKAVSKGLELSAVLRPTEHLTINGWVARGQAELASDLTVLPGGGRPQTFGRDGDRLPYSPRWSGSIEATQEFPFVAGSTGSVGGAVTYQGSRLGELTCIAGGCPAPGPVARGVLPSYTRIDLRAGAKWDAWSVSVYLNNVTDKRGILTGGPGAFNVNGYSYIQPRTFGVTLARKWD